MTFWASRELIANYREYCVRCKAKQIQPMDCQAFYDATKNGQKLIEEK
jgi:hypothetical protein